MNEREVLSAADAVFDAERALWRAAETVDKLEELAASSLRVLDDAATDTFNAHTFNEHQDERRDFYLESASDHLERLRKRSDLMKELGKDLTRHLSTAGTALERAGYELTPQTDGDERDLDVRALRTQVDVLSEVVQLARPVADHIIRHAQYAQAAAESVPSTDDLTSLDERVHHAERDVARVDADVSMMRSVIASTQPRARLSAVLAVSLSSPPMQPNKPAGPGIAI